MPAETADPRQEELIHVAARIFCEENLWDYRSAKLKALQRLGRPTRKSALPDNARIQAAVIEYQRLYGGETYRHWLRQCRRTAVQAMQLLSAFSPRLTGAVVTGAVTLGHRVQLHAFSDSPESLDFFLQDHGIPFEQDERQYRYPDGSQQCFPLSRFEAGEVGVDVCTFPLVEKRRPPLSPSDGLPAQRLKLSQARRLAGLETD